MYTRCPVCHTLFRILPQQLKAARGKVRCGECQTTFDALEYLVAEEELSENERQAIGQSEEPESLQQPLPFSENVPPPTAANNAKKRRNPQENDAGTPLSVEQIEMMLGNVSEQEEYPQEDEVLTSVPSPEADEPSTVHNPATTPRTSERLASKPEFTHRSDEPTATTPRYALPEAEHPLRHSAASRLGWTFASLLLLLLVAGQLIFANRDTLAGDPRWRPWLEQACQIAGCTLPVQRDLSSIEMTERTVLSHPKYQNALLITATLLNKAPFAQPYPKVELIMTDLEQKVVASRTFKPNEYLKDGDPTKLFPAGGAVQLQLEIADPGEQAVGFEFNFY